MSQWDLLVRDIERMNASKAALRRTKEELRQSKGRQALFRAMLQALPSGHALHDEHLRTEIWQLGVNAFDAGRELSDVDLDGLQKRLDEDHQNNIRLAVAGLEALQPVERGVIFKHWTLEFWTKETGMEITKLPSTSIKTEGDVAALRERAIRLAREAPRGAAITPDIALRRALSNS